MAVSCSCWVMTWQDSWIASFGNFLWHIHESLCTSPPAWSTSESLSSLLEKDWVEFMYQFQVFLDCAGMWVHWKGMARTICCLALSVMNGFRRHSISSCSMGSKDHGILIINKANLLQHLFISSDLEWTPASHKTILIMLIYLYGIKTSVDLALNLARGPLWISPWKDIL